MTKKETAAFEALQNELQKEKDNVRVAKALRWTHPITTDVAPPTRSMELTTGYLYSSYSGIGGDSVTIACSGVTGHARGRVDKTTTQNARHLYSTKLRALQALRHEVEQQCAARLAAIDKQIEQEGGVAS
jgi:hypothetical protein